MNNQTLGEKIASNSFLETNLKINEILIAYPDNYLENLGKIFITRAYYIEPSFRNSFDLRLEADSYKILNYKEINSKLRNFVDERIKGKSKKNGGIGGALCISRNLEESISILDKCDYNPIMKLTLIRTEESRNIKDVKFSLWGNDLIFLRSELNETNKYMGEKK